MSETIVTLSQSSHAILLKLAQASGEPISETLDKAIETYRRSQFLLQANQAFEALKQNPVLWQEELEERQLWDQTLADGASGS